MPIDFTCPHCGNQTLVADQYVGHSGPCGHCGQTVVIASSQVASAFSDSPYAAPRTMQPPRPSAETDVGMRMLLPVGRSLWAIFAGYLGLFSLLIFPAPIALLFGIIAVRDIRQNENKHGMGRAIFGIVMGALGSIVILFGLFSIFAEM